MKDETWIGAAGGGKTTLSLMAVKNTILALEKTPFLKGEWKMGDNMRGIYDVVVVNTKNRAVILEKNNRVAISEEEAKFEAGVYKALNSMGLKLSDVYISCKCKDIFEVEES